MILENEKQPRDKDERSDDTVIAGKWLHVTCEIRSFVNLPLSKFVLNVHVEA